METAATRWQLRTYTFPWRVAVTSNRRLIPGPRRWTLNPRYRAAVDELHAHARNQHGRAPFDGPVAVAIRVYPPDRRRRDIQNLAKLILDGLEGAAYRDDAQVERLVIERLGMNGTGRVEVEVSPR